MNLLKWATNTSFLMKLVYIDTWSGVSIPFGDNHLVFQIVTWKYCNWQVTFLTNLFIKSLSLTQNTDKIRILLFTTRLCNNWFIEVKIFNIPLVFIQNGAVLFWIFSNTNILTWDNKLPSTWNQKFAIYEMFKLNALRWILESLDSHSSIEEGII